MTLDISGHSLPSTRLQIPLARSVSRQVAQTDFDECEGIDDSCSVNTATLSVRHARDEDDVRHGSVSCSYAPGAPFKGARPDASSSSSYPLLHASLRGSVSSDKLAVLEARCEQLAAAKAQAEQDRRDVEDVCLRLRSKVQCLESELKENRFDEVGDESSIAALKEELDFQERVALTYRQESERLAAEVKSLKKEGAVCPTGQQGAEITPPPEGIRSQLSARIESTKEIERLGEQLTVLHAENEKLREEISRSKRGQKREKALIQTVAALEGALAKKIKGDGAFEAVLSALKGLVGSSGDAESETIRRIKGEALMLDDQWSRKVAVLHAEHTKMKFEWESEIRNLRLLNLKESTKTNHVDSSAIQKLQDRIDFLERELSAAKSLLEHKIKENPHKTISEKKFPSPLLNSAEALGIFLTLPQIAPALFVLSAISGERPSRENFEKLEKFLAPVHPVLAACMVRYLKKSEKSFSENELFSEIRRVVCEQILDEKCWRVNFLESELKETCMRVGGEGLLAAVVADLEISSVDEWGDSLRGVLDRCGLDSLSSRVKDWPGVPLNWRHLQNSGKNYLSVWGGLLKEAAGFRSSLSVQFSIADPERTGFINLFDFLKSLEISGLGKLAEDGGLVLAAFYKGSHGIEWGRFLCDLPNCEKSSKEYSTPALLPPPTCSETPHVPSSSHGPSSLPKKSIRKELDELMDGLRILQIEARGGGG